MVTIHPEEQRKKTATRWSDDLTEIAGTQWIRVPQELVESMRETMFSCENINTDMMNTKYVL